VSEVHVERLPFAKPSKYDRTPRGASHLGEGLPFAKRRRVRDQKAIDAYRLTHPRCEGCGKRKSAEVHHIRSKARGGDDAPENFLALCGGARGCHRAWASIDVTRREWLEKRRSSMTAEAIQKVERVLELSNA
jgi:hypothetical protein